MTTSRYHLLLLQRRRRYLSVSLGGFQVCPSPSRDREIRPRVGGQLKLAEEEENETTRFLSVGLVFLFVEMSQRKKNYLHKIPPPQRKPLLRVHCAAV